VLARRRGCQQPFLDEGPAQHAFWNSYPRPTNIPGDIVSLIREHLDVIYRPNTRYRATGVVLSDLRGEGETQLDLFGEALRAARIRQVYEAVDQLDAKYGKHTVFLGSSFAAMHASQHAGDRGELPRRQQTLLKGEGKRRRLEIPLLGEV
jgi:hypothetical protein